MRASGPLLLQGADSIVGPVIFRVLEIFLTGEMRAEGLRLGMDSAGNCFRRGHEEGPAGSPGGLDVSGAACPGEQNAGVLFQRRRAGRIMGPCTQGNRVIRAQGHTLGILPGSGAFLCDMPAVAWVIYEFENGAVAGRQMASFSLNLAAGIRSRCFAWSSRRSRSSWILIWSHWKGMCSSHGSVIGGAGTPGVSCIAQRRRTTRALRFRCSAESARLPPTASRSSPQRADMPVCTRRASGK